MYYPLMWPQLVIAIGQCVIRMQYFRNRHGERAGNVVSYWKIAMTLVPEDNKIKKRYWEGQKNLYENCIKTWKFYMISSINVRLARRKFEDKTRTRFVNIWGCRKTCKNSHAKLLSLNSVAKIVSGFCISDWTVHSNWSIECEWLRLQVSTFSCKIKSFSFHFLTFLSLYFHHDMNTHPRTITNINIYIIALSLLQCRSDRELKFNPLALTTNGNEMHGNVYWLLPLSIFHMKITIAHLCYEKI